MHIIMLLKESSLRAYRLVSDVLTSTITNIQHVPDQDTCGVAS